VGSELQERKVSESVGENISYRRRRKVKVYSPGALRREAL
jgi:hypothetical protein